MRISTRIAVALAACGVAFGGCQDLDVTNPNQADRERAVRQPDAVESIIASSFVSWWEWVHDDSPVFVTTTVADEFTSAFADFGQLETSSEPRQSWNNSPVSNRAAATEDPWYGLYGTISTVNDGLIALDGGMVIGDASRTARAKSFGKFMQALGHGYVALYFDKGFIVDETVDVTSIPPGEAGARLRPYTEVMDSAISYMNESIAIASTSTFTLPNSDADTWLFTPMSSADFARLGHSFLARFLAYAPRTRAERDAVDWAEVISHIDAGITTDFAPNGRPDVMIDDFKRLAARVRNTTRPGDFARLDYWLVGPADTTQAFLNWVATPLANRKPFQIRTPDRRIQAAAVGSKGKYFGYNTATLFADSRGTYHQSFYYFHRYGTGETWQNGPLVAMTVAEMDLLKAEALIRLNRAAEAVPLINKTRVANGELPPVTIAGPPDAPGCVPRKLNGSCGSLWDALRYEKRIEMAGVDPTVAYFDARGWQTLLENSFVHFPVPGRELETLGLPLYTFGGGLAGSALAPDREKCPGTEGLPRCP